MALMEYMNLYDERKKIKEKREWEMWWMMVSAKTQRSAKFSVASLLLPYVSLYRLQLDFGLYLSVAKIFYLYLIN